MEIVFDVKCKIPSKLRVEKSCRMDNMLLADMTENIEKKKNSFISDLKYFGTQIKILM